MITLLDIADWLVEEEIAENTYAGKLASKPEQAIGVYQREGGQPRKCLGRLESYDIKRISLLIHWTKDSDETERAAAGIYERLEEKSRQQFTIGTTYIPYLSVVTTEPVDVGTDNAGIYERVIWLDFYYEKG